MALTTESAEKQAKRDPRGDPARVAAYRFKPGQTGNPKGRPRKVRTPPDLGNGAVTKNTFRHGRNWEIHLPPPYKELYEAAITDPSLLRLERDVSLLDSRL